VKLVRTFVIMATLIAAGTAAFAQSAALAVTSTAPTVDGVVNAGEYGWSTDLKGLALYASRTADSLFVAVVGDTKGWVAFGLGSQRMNGATIFMGFVKADGTVEFKPQEGRGRAHFDVGAGVTATVVAHKMTEADGKTTLEVELKAAPYIAAGAAGLDAIWAMGSADSFLPVHVSRGSLSIPLAK
jgi:hypothetical protein